jgi:hypothetical protein
LPAAKAAVATAIVDTMQTAVVVFHFLLEFKVGFIVDPNVKEKHRGT